MWLHAMNTWEHFQLKHCSFQTTYSELVCAPLIISFHQLYTYLHSQISRLLLQEVPEHIKRKICRNNYSQTRLNKNSERSWIWMILLKCIWHGKRSSHCWTGIYNIHFVCKKWTSFKLCYGAECNMFSPSVSSEWQIEKQFNRVRKLLHSVTL